MKYFNSEYILLSLLFILTSCGGDDDLNLPPVEERVNAAVTQLENNLVGPTNGWRLEYTPTDESGIFFMILDFGIDGKVNIQSDVIDNDGEFLNHTIPYRIDNSLGLELVLETFGVFHHLFEQDQASFGAEFEFIFVEKEGENLIFESKSDVFSPSRIVLEPAGPNDDSSFSTELAINLSAFDIITPQIFGLEPSIQQIILVDHGISIFWSMDIVKRNINVDFATVGTTIEEISSNGMVNIDHSTGYSLRNGSLILLEPFGFQLSGQNISIDEIILSDLQMNGERICINGTDTNPVYNGGASGLGAVQMKNSYLNSAGTAFQGDIYQVNALFIFDIERKSLLEEGIIKDLFPTASGFIFVYGVELNNPDIPINSVGLIMDDGALYLREFEATTTSVNKVSITLNDNFYYDATPPVGTKENLRALTDLLFEGGQVYAFYFPIEGLNLFRLFNPCNGIEIFLVGS